jgi:hypothetical protein
MKQGKQAHWVTELAQQERERRNQYPIVRQACGTFQKILTEQLRSDFAVYCAEFPEESANVRIKYNESDHTVITMDNGDPEVSPCQVRFTIMVHEMRLLCQFSHRPELNKVFDIVHNADGSIGLADGSIADLSRYLLAPVLFGELIPDHPPNPS